MRPAHLFLGTLTLGLCAWTHVALANGAGYSFGVQFTGSVAPFQAPGTESVRVQQEQLDIRLRRTDAAVQVRYVMKNVAKEPMKVRFGFPVEAIAPTRGEDDMDEAPYDRAGVIKDLPHATQQLKGYSVTADGKPVPAEFQVEPFGSGKVAPFPGSEQLEGIAGWMVSEVEFPAGQPLSLAISYSADYAGVGRWPHSSNWPRKSIAKPLF